MKKEKFYSVILEDENYIQVFKMMQKNRNDYYFKEGMKANFSIEFGGNDGDKMVTLNDAYVHTEMEIFIRRAVELKSKEIIDLAFKLEENEFQRIKNLAQAEASEIIAE